MQLVTMMLSQRENYHGNLEKTCGNDKKLISVLLNVYKIAIQANNASLCCSRLSTITNTLITNSLCINHMVFKLSKEE